MANKKLVVLLTAVAAVVVIALVYYFMVLRKQTSTAQAVTVSIPSTTISPPRGAPALVPPPPPAYPQIPVEFGSFLQPGVIMKVVAPPVPVGDSVWVPLQYLGSSNILVYEVMSAIDAKILGIGSTITQGSLVKIGLTPPPAQSQPVSYYSSYGLQQTTLTAGLVRSIIRGNKNLFKLLRDALNTNNQALLQNIQQSYVGNQTFEQIINVIINTGGMPAPLAIKYSTAYALGIVPPVITQQITNLNVNPSGVVIDFGAM